MANPAYKQAGKQAVFTDVEPDTASEFTFELNSSPFELGFAPWSLPAAFGLMLGVVAGRLEFFWLLALLCAFGVIAATLGRWRLLLIFALCLPVGYARFAVWNVQAIGQMERLEPLYGEREFSGYSDGTILRLDDPKGVRVAISPRGALEAGQVTLQGELSEAGGKRNPGGFDYGGYLRRRGIWGQLYVEEVLNFDAAAPSLKDRLRRGVTTGLSEKRAALMQAMTLGIRDDLGDLREIFAASGLAHVLALSGLHVGILVAALNWLLTPLGLRRYPLLIALVLGYVFLVGFSPSVVRAGAMAVALLASLHYGAGRIDTWASLALSASLSLLFNPAWLFDISFQLSYLAVAGILLFTGPLTKLVLGERKLGTWHPLNLTVGMMMVSVAAQILTLPLIVSSFGSLPLFSPVVNVLAIPLASVLVPLGFLAGVAGLVSAGLAGFVNLLTGLCAGFLIWLADAGSSLPSLIWGEVSWLGYALFYIAVLALALAFYKRLKLWRALLVMLVAGLCSGLTPSQHAPPELIILDVGQGDSALVRLPGRKEILVDAGGTPFSDYDVGKGTVLPALKALGVDELELVIASHSDADHMEGLVSVLEAMPVGQLVVGARTEDFLFARLAALAESKNVPLVQVARGQSLTLGEARLDILGPPRKLYAKDNDNSVTFVLNYQNIPKALLMGDLSIAAEAGMAFPDVDVVMAAHHGAKSSTSSALLAAAQPEHIVFSYGRNSYGHPHPDALERARKSGAIIYKTGEQGAVRFKLR